MEETTMNRTAQLEAQVSHLTNMVETLEGRFAQLEEKPAPNGDGGKPRSRRDLLKLAGAAAVGSGGIRCPASSSGLGRDGRELDSRFANSAHGQAPQGCRSFKKSAGAWIGSFGARLSRSRSPVTRIAALDVARATR